MAKGDPNVRFKDVAADAFAGHELFFQHVKTVSDVMTRPVQTIRMTATVQDSVSAMHASRIRHLVVVDGGTGAGQQLVGVISQRDLCRRSARGPEANEAIGGVVSRETHVLGPEDPFGRAVDIMLKHKVDCLPVVGVAGEPVGIVTPTDIITTLFHAVSMSQLAQAQGATKVRPRDLVACPGRDLTTAALIDAYYRRVEEVMTADVMTLGPDDSMATAMDLMQTRRLRHAPVVNSDGQLLGLVSDRDLLNQLNARAGQPDGMATFRSRLFAVAAGEAGVRKTLRAVMTEAAKVVTVRRSTLLIDSIRIVLAHQINCLPVVDSDGGQPVVCGIVTTTDFLRICAALGKVMAEDDLPAQAFAAS